ncbi:MAG: GAF domain-containing protein [Candidatus Sulfotelmatobacter sp.]
MDHYSILDHSSSSLAMEGDLPVTASASGPASISAGIAAANALLPKLSENGPRFPGEDGGRSLAEMAHSDLDAALQLLAERAQYITGASGVAIALRRGAHNHMLCRASTGSNAPELGALLSTEYGLSGESVRTRQLLRCDDAERDPRVNRDVCRDLGIASVVVMPIVGEDRVLGVFELLSGKPHAFDERDLSALSRLAEMVETAVLHAQFTPAIPELVVPESAAPQSAVPQSKIRVNVVSVKAAPSESESKPRETSTAPAAPSPSLNILPPRQSEAAPVPPSAKKPLFWSAAMRAQSPEKLKEKEETQAIAVPAGLRNLQKCQACGFPVSQGRDFCVECEERQWRGQRLPHPEVKSPKDKDKVQDNGKDKGKENGRDKAQDHAASPAPKAPAVIAKTETHGTFIQDFLPNHAPFQTPPPTGAKLTISAPSTEAASPSQELISQPIAPAAPEAAVAQQPSSASASSSDTPSNAPIPDSSTLFLSSAQSESWFASNKYILGALLVVAIIVAAIVWLR